MQQSAQQSHFVKGLRGKTMGNKEPQTVEPPGKLTCISHQKVRNAPAKPPFSQAEILRGQPRLGSALCADCSPVGEKSGLTVEMQGKITVKGTLIITPKGPADRKPGAKILNKILQMDGEKIARELPAEHHLLVDGWGQNMFVPSMVYMTEKDRLLLGCYSRGDSVNDPMQAILIVSDDHGRTWSNPINRSMGQGNVVAPGMSLSYLGKGTLLGTGEGSGENTGWLSRDYGETWASFPSPHTASGFAIYMWDPCLTDKDPVTRELKRS